MLIAVRAVIPDRPPLTLGLATTFHVEPFQCSPGGKPPLPFPLPYEPTAQTLLAEMAATPFRKLELVPALGLETALHPPQWPVPLRRCGRVAADAPAKLARNTAASARTVTLGKRMIFRRFMCTPLYSLIIFFALTVVYFIVVVIQGNCTYPLAQPMQKSAHWDCSSGHRFYLSHMSVYLHSFPRVA